MKRRRILMLWTYHVYEIAQAALLLLPCMHHEPRLVTLRHDGGSGLTLDAFWDGGKERTVRFACPHSGRRTYESASGDGGLDGETGQIACVQPSVFNLQRNANLRGGLQVEGRHFAYADGTPFLGLADGFWDFNLSS